MAAMKSTKTKTAGAIWAGAGDKYQFKKASLKKVAAGTGYSTSNGGVVEGARLIARFTAFCSPWRISK